MVSEFCTPVSASFARSSPFIECDCRVTADEIRFSAARAGPVPVTKSLYLDIFNHDKGFSICNDGVQATVFTSDPEKQSALVDAIAGSLKKCTFKLHSEIVDEYEWYHRIFRGTLHSACVMEDQERLEKIMAGLASFSIDRQDSHGRTALFYACSRDFKPGVELLIKAGADPVIDDKDGVTPLHISSRLAHANTIQYLLKSGAGVIPAEFDLNSKSPVWLAACSDSPRAVACLKALLQHGFSADMVGDGKHLLHVVCMNGNTDIVECLLVDATLDPNVVSGEGHTPLHYAVRENTSDNPALVKALLWAGAYANYPSDDGQKNTPLHLCRQEELAMALVSYGARPETLNAAGQAATHLLSDDVVKRLSSTCSARWKLKREVAILFCPNAPYRDGPSCRLCRYTFLPIFGRKHHCRICGNLVCEACSQKRVTFSSQAYRACDGCFNRAVEAVVAFQMVPSSLQAAPDTPPNELLPSPEPEPVSPSMLADRPYDHPDEGTVRPLRALQERGQALDELGNQSGALRNNAEQFANLADRLAEKFGK